MKLIEINFLSLRIILSNVSINFGYTQHVVVTYFCHSMYQALECWFQAFELEWYIMVLEVYILLVCFCWRFWWFKEAFLIIKLSSFVYAIEVVFSFHLFRISYLWNVSLKLWVLHYSLKKWTSTPKHLKMSHQWLKQIQK